MEKCPKCAANEKQVKDGHHRSGSQRYRCQKCGHKYTPQPLAQGYSEEVRTRALQLHVDGLSYHQIARHLQVVHQTVANWVSAYSDQLPPAPTPPQPVAVVEQDELFTFVGTKKRPPIS
jgi:transposase-like protein